LGTVPSSDSQRQEKGTVPAAGTVPLLLATIFAVTDLSGPARLGTVQLQQLLAQRIQQDYQKGALVHIQGWWLARSEAAILQLGCLIAARGEST
jgi:hypothetical protein